MPGSVPRKLLSGKSPEAQALRAQFNQWHVDGYCTILWNVNRLRRRKDTFIGLFDTVTWTIYLAPCFGVTADECATKLGKAAAGNDPDLRDLRERLARFENIPNDLNLVSGSTSIEADAARTLRWSDIKPIYGKGACLVPWSRQKNSFDGHSHATMITWIRFNDDIETKPGAGWGSTARGFAIQRDSEGYYVRFASGFNQQPSSAVTGDTYGVFQARSVNGQAKGYDDTHELRDLPKEWAMKLMEILARDLHVGYYKPSELDYSDKVFERMVSRGEDRTSKFKRIF